MQRDQRKRQELGKPERARTVPSPRAAGDEVSVDRDRLLNDILNTGVMGALIGGFALSNLQLNYDTAKTVEVAIYLTSFIGVHACTCSCVTSAMLYKYANELSEAETPCWVRSSTWGLRNSFLLQLPFWKFGMGCVSYLASVVLMSYRDLGPIPFWKWTALSIGLMSMSMTMLVALMMFGPGSGARMKILQMQAMGPVAAKQEELQQRQEEEQQDSSVGGVTQVIEIK